MSIYLRDPISFSNLGEITESLIMILAMKSLMTKKTMKMKKEYSIQLN